MNLKNKELVERKKLTSHYPLLIAGDTGSGKSTALSNMNLIDKKRTVIFNFDEKHISENDEEFYKVISGFKISDFDLINKLDTAILKYAKDDNVDRIVIDTFTSMTKLINRWSAEHHRGFDIWNAYNNSITQLINTIKTATLIYGKFGIVMGHYPPKENGNIKRYLTTKGKEHTNVIEEQFNTVVESFIEDGAIHFKADVWDTSNTTKTKLIEGSFQFKRTALTDLEDLFNKIKKIENGELVDA